MIRGIQRTAERAGRAASVLCVLVFAGYWPPLHAEEVLRDITGEEVAELLRGANMSVQVSQDQYGDPVIYGASGEHRFRVWPYDCAGTPRRCRQIEFSAGFRTNEPVPLEVLDAFNERWVFGKAYLGNNGVAYLDFAINLNRGVTAANVASNVRIWQQILSEFQDHIGPYQGS